MFLYIKATDPRVPVEIRFWNREGWQLTTIEIKAGGVLGALDEYLKGQQKTVLDIRALFVFMGQGSFTATRSITTIANTLALAVAVPIFALDAPPTENPELLLSKISATRYILPKYSVPARVGSSTV